jgi:hypothetical protein
MYFDLIVWDDEDDPNGKRRHMVSTGLVTIAEFVDVIDQHQ